MGQLESCFVLLPWSPLRKDTASTVCYTRVSPAAPSHEAPGGLVISARSPDPGDIRAEGRSWDLGAVKSSAHANFPCPSDVTFGIEK